MLALVCGLAAAFGIRLLRGGGVTEVSPETVPVVVAKSDIPRGHVIGAEELETRPWPKEYLPATAVSDVEACVDRAVVAPIVAGEPLLEGKLMSKDARDDFAARVPVGMRAYTIQTTEDASKVAGLLAPGDHVDVLCSLRGGPSLDATGGGSTVTLLQAVTVLAIGQNMVAPTAEDKKDVRDLRSVTLVVTPDQVALLDLGQNKGQLTLSLRNPQDTDVATPASATVDMLRHLQGDPVDQPDDTPEVTMPVVEKPAARIMQIRSIRGRQVGRARVKSSS